ncbi:MAG: hypothetical protein WEA76_03170 [Acidimicrobiia bacterium]
MSESAYATNSGIPSFWRRELPWALFGIATSGLYSAIFSFKFVGTHVDSDDIYTVGAWYRYIAIAAGLTVVVFAVSSWVLVRSSSAARVSVVLGVLAVVSYPAYWLSLPTVFASAALMSGVEAATTERSWLAWVGIALGVAAIVAGALLVSNT